MFDPGQTLRYAFDALNRLTNMVDAVGTSRFSYVLRTLLTAYFWRNWHRMDFGGLAGVPS
jgi:hypothetical protein